MMNGGEKTTIIIKRLLSAILFCVVFLTAFTGFSEVLRKKLSNTDRIHEFYGLEKDSLDAVFVGSSHIYYGIYPDYLWQRSGIASYDLASPNQSIPVSYYLIRDAIRLQHPEVIVLDVYYLFQDIYAFSQARLHEAADSMPFWSVNRLRMIHDLAGRVEGEESVYSFYIPLVLYHSRWKELETKDFTIETGYLKGANVKVTSEKTTMFEPLEERVELPAVTMDYLARIEEECEKTGTKLVLLSVPFSGKPKEEEKIRRFLALDRTFSEYAEEHSIDFLNLQEQWETLGLNWEEDFYEPAHLNCYGAEKLTFYIADYLSEKYGLPDHRGDPRYAQWDKDLKTFNRYVGRMRKKAGAE